MLKHYKEFIFKRQCCRKPLKKLDFSECNTSTTNNNKTNLQKGKNLDKMDNIAKCSTCIAFNAVEKEQQRYDDMKVQIRESINRMFNKWQKITPVYYEKSNANFINESTEKVFKRIIDNIEEFTHMKEVRASQEHVKKVRDTLLDKNNQKRCILKELDDVRTELSNIYRDMKAANNRSPEKYLELTRQEIELLQKEKECMDEFQKIDKEEQHILNYEFTAAINDSYDKEKIHTNFIKILGIIGAALGSVLTLIVTLVGYAIQQNRNGLLIKEVEAVVGQKISESMNRINYLLKCLDERKEKKEESWSSYIKRHTSWMYSWAMRKS